MEGNDEKHKKLCIKHKWLSRVLGALIAIIPAFFCFVFVFLCFPSQIVVEPQKLDVSLSPGENFTKTISIEAIGKDDVTVTLKTTGPIEKWVNFYLFSIDAKFEDDLKNNNISENLKNIFKTKRFLIPENSTGKDDKWVITRGEKTYYIIKKEDGKLNVYLCRDASVPVEVNRTQYLNLNLNILPDTTPGEYRGAIQISDNAKVKAEIPVFIKIHKTMAQIVEIEAPPKVNVSEHFKITAKIKNTGDYDALGVTASVNLTNAPGLVVVDEEIEKIAIIPKNEIIYADWWLKVNQTTIGWKTIKVNLRLKNAGNDTEIIDTEIIAVEVI